MTFNKELVLDYLTTLLDIPSPTGYADEAITFLENYLKQYHFRTYLTPKGNLVVKVKGEDEEIMRALSGHIDTLGLMVRSINTDGTLNVTALGGPLTPTLDGEYCQIITRSGNVYTGTILSKSTSIHVHKDASTRSRSVDELHIVIDEKVSSKEEVKELGIQNGDIVAYDPKTQITSSGFIKSRFLDDKASVAILVHLLHDIAKGTVKPSTNLAFVFTVYEEVGHGCSWLPETVSELLAVDMGAIGLDLETTEFDVSICAKDSSGPYDYQLTSDLICYAKKQDLNYAVDIYPMYGSDASAALRGGANIRAGLVGPGVANSHGMERMHIDALENTYYLLKGYIEWDK